MWRSIHTREPMTATSAMAVEGKESFLEKREPNWDDFPYYY